MMKPAQLTITVLPLPKRKCTTGWGHGYDLVVRSSTGMIVAFNNWPAVLRLLESDADADLSRVTVRVADELQVPR